MDTYSSDAGKWKTYFILHRFDFILHANKEAKVYQMKFGGLYDCAPTKVHGVGLLIYDNVKPDIVSFTIKDSKHIQLLTHQ